MPEWFMSGLMTLWTLAEASGVAPEGGSGGPPKPPQQSGGEQIIQMLGMMLPMALIFYLLIWRPESKRRKEQEQTLLSLKEKDKIVTIGGVHGTVAKIDKDEITLIIDAKKDVRIKVDRSSVRTINPGSKKADGDEKK